MSKEYFRKLYDSKIDSAVDKQIEFITQNQQNLEVNITKVVSQQFRSALKKAILTDVILDDEKVTNEELKEVFTALPLNLLQKFQITTFAEFQIFIAKGDYSYIYEHPDVNEYFVMNIKTKDNKNKKAIFLDGKIFIITNGKITQKELFPRKNKKLSQEKITNNFRKAEIKDIEAFSNIFSKLNTPEALQKYIVENPNIWNPKNEPNLYADQQCADTVASFLIEYFWKNKIDLVLPAGNTFFKMSNFTTSNNYRRALYRKLSASHFTYGANIMDRIEEHNVKAGDIMFIKHKSGGFHLQIITSNIVDNQYSRIYGNQINNDFKSSVGNRILVASQYPSGYIDTQKDIESEKIKMKSGGYGVRPIVSSENLMKHKKAEDAYTFFRINPKKLNKMLSQIL